MIFSVIIPVYNGSNFLEYAINSVLNQDDFDISDVEIIVVNDGSTDNGKTKSIALKYLDRLKYIEKENGGVSTALNLGISMATGDYICWLSHDDIFLPNKLRTQYDLIQKINLSNDMFVLFAEQNYIDKAGELINKPRRTDIGSVSKQKTYSGLDMAACIFSRGIKLAGCTVVIPRRLFTENIIKNFDTNLRYIQDLTMWLEMSMNNVTFIIDERVLVSSRVHSAQQTGRYLDRYYEESKVFCTKFVHDYKFLLNESSNRSLLTAFTTHYGRFFSYSDFKREFTPFLSSDFKIHCMFFYGKTHEFVLSIYRVIINSIHR